MAESGLTRPHLPQRTQVVFATLRIADRQAAGTQRRAGAGQARSRGTPESRGRTTELAHVPARRRGETESSAGADAAEHPGARRDRGHVAAVAPVQGEPPRRPAVLGVDGVGEPETTPFCIKKYSSTDRLGTTCSARALSHYQQMMTIQPTSRCQSIHPPLEHRLLPYTSELPASQRSP